MFHSTSISIIYQSAALCGEAVRADVEDLAEQLGIAVDWVKQSEWGKGLRDHSAARVVLVFQESGSNLAAKLDEALDVPVLVVPVSSGKESALATLLEVAGEEAGGGAGRLAIGSAGARNAVLEAAAILALVDTEVARRLDDFRVQQTERVLGMELPKLT